MEQAQEMYYEDDNFSDPWRKPETVVLHHGNSKNTKLWYAWVPLLARQYRVIRLDARGCGRSTVPPEGYDWSLSNWVPWWLKANLARRPESIPNFASQWNRIRLPTWLRLDLSPWRAWALFAEAQSSV